MPTLRDLKIGCAIAVISSLVTLIATFTVGDSIGHGLLVLASKFEGAAASATIVTETAPSPISRSKTRR